MAFKDIYERREYNRIYYSKHKDAKHEYYLKVDYKKSKCIDCGKEIKRGSKRCYACTGKEKRNIALKNFKPNLCIDCGKELSDKRPKKCQSCARKGHIVSEETRKKSREISLQQFKDGMPLSTRAKISKSTTGEKNHFYGKTHTEETRKIIGLYKKNKTWEEMYGKEKAEELKKLMGSFFKGEKSHMKLMKYRIMNSAKFQGISVEQWKGFISFEPYTLEFNDTFKEAIRFRDNLACVKCSLSQENSKKIYNQKLHVHHINYDKKVTTPENCCTLCVSCNIKSNTNRIYWTKFFQSLLSEKYGYKYQENAETILGVKNVIAL